MKMEKTVTEAIAYRRSVRIYNQEEEIDTEIVKKCIEKGFPRNLARLAAREMVRKPKVKTNTDA